MPDDFSIILPGVVFFIEPLKQMCIVFLHTSWVWAGASNHSVTYELMSLALCCSHLGGSVLTRRLLAQLIAICIALLVSQHCLCDISLFFSPFLALLSLPDSHSWLAFWGRGIRQCLVCD